MLDEHRAEGEERAQTQAKAESRELLPRPRALEVPERPQVDTGREELVRDEQDAASAQCYPKFSRTRSALRKLSNSSGNVLADAELDHCEMFAIPSSDVKVGAYIGMGACCHVMRGAWRGRSVAIKTIKICDSAGADDAADNNSKSKDIIKEIALMCRSFATVSHPNIVGFYGICIDGPQPWLIMEYVGGGSYVCVCVCVCVRECLPSVCVCTCVVFELLEGYVTHAPTHPHTHTHTHTHTGTLSLWRGHFGYTYTHQHTHTHTGRSKTC
jgi:serine/threonine protein kinase